VLNRNTSEKESSMKNTYASILSTSAILLSATLLQACSGHPGAGHWESSIESSNSLYSALETEFDGKGALHPNQLVPSQEGKEDLWCIWQAKSATALDVQCGDGSAEKTNIKFELVVTESQGAESKVYAHANLLQDGKVVATFNRKK